MKTFLAIALLTAGTTYNAFAQSPDVKNAVVSLRPEAACALNKKEEVISPETIYSLSGHYFSELHGSLLEIPGCDRVIFPSLEGKARAMISKYHDAVRRDCKWAVMGDSISGTFTGRFVTEQKTIVPTGPTGLRPHTMTTQYFVITDIETKDLDMNSITCSTGFVH